MGKQKAEIAEDMIATYNVVYGWRIEMLKCDFSFELFFHHHHPRKVTTSNRIILYGESSGLSNGFITGTFLQDNQFNGLAPARNKV